jgi:hypothetical protein
MHAVELGEAHRFACGAHKSSYRREASMGLEAAFFIGAFILLVALIYGTISYRYRSRAANRLGDEITRERYRNDQA